MTPEFKKICAVICEFNPMHTGHEYLLRQLKDCGCDAVVCLMSGNFVQRAEPALCDKYLRALTALRCGADIVLELPAIHATASGERFASGAVGILNRLNVIDCLAFGCETPDAALLSGIAALQANESPSFKHSLTFGLARGLSYPAALADATAEELKNSEFDASMLRIVLKNPNNLLAIEYLKAMIKSNSNLKPLYFKRIGSGYNDTALHADYASASAIRLALSENRAEEIKSYLPGESAKPLLDELLKHSADYGVYSALSINALRDCDISALPECGEGLDHKLKTAALRFTDLTDVLNYCKSKRYTLSRLKRICLQALLGITNEYYRISDAARPRLLAVKNTHKSLLGYFKNSVISQNGDYERLNEQEIKIAEVDKKASSIYSLITKKQGDQFFTNKIITL